MMYRFLKIKWKEFKSEEWGIFSIEFALIMPLLVMMMFGTIEIGLIMFTQSLMEGALRDASRYGITGQVIDDEDRLTTIKKVISSRTVGLVNMDTAKIDVLSYPNFGKIGTGEAFLDGNGNAQYDVGETFTDENDNNVWDADIGSAGAGNAGDVVLYRIQYDWPLISNYMDSFIGDSGKLPLSASVAVRNEPWDLTK